MTIRSTRLCRLLCAASAIGLSIPAAAQDRPAGAEETPGIIINDALTTNDPAPIGSVDNTGIIGVGQQIAFLPNAAQTGASLSLCSGTLINPRTVVFAAHCVNSRPAHLYGSQTGSGGGINPGTALANSFGATNGIPYSFGFDDTNRCTGTATSAGNGCLSGTGPYELWRDSNFSTQAASGIFNVNQIWWDPRSQNPGSIGFLMGDVALATLDTPAFDVPTWAMLFSPLEGPTESRLIGYGTNNTQAAAQGAGCPAPYNSCSAIGTIDYRRRSASNMISVLGSLNDRNLWLFGSNSVVNNLYMQSFSSPLDANGNPTNQYDFGIFGGGSRGDAPLPREGITGGGDSGGPLVVDSLGRSVVVGVLSGGSRFYNAQRFSTYGTHNFYQPLHAYWDVIVANNPYIYAGNKAGNGNWEDPGHWVQLMDPNYMILQGGALVNGLPDTPAEGVTGTGAKFGYICFLDDCTELQQDAPTGDGNAIYVMGGPGTMNFVPNNVEPINSPNPALHRRASYYDVILTQAGSTALSSAVTIDRLTLDGQTKLDVRSGGNLGVLGEINQYQGWTNVDGTLRSGRDMMVLSGLLSGSGTVAAPYLTVIGGIVAPGGGDRIGTLTVQGDMIMSSASALFVDARRGSADRLVVTAGSGNTGILALDGGNIVFNKVTDAPAPRHGESYVIASAAGGVVGTFAGAYTFQGVLRPELSYGPNSVTATLRAGSLVQVIGQSNPQAVAFARALDRLRGSNYANLFNLYGNIDWMNGGQLSQTLSSLAPRVLGDVGSLHDHQSKLLMTTVSDRLSLIGSGEANGLAVSGSPLGAIAAGNGMESGRMAFGGNSTTSVAVDALPGKLSGFVSGGVERTRSTYGEQAYSAGQGAWHMAMGLELPFAGGKIGTAAGYSEGVSSPDGDSNRSRTTMAAAYGAVPVGSGFYVGGMMTAETARAAVGRLGFDGATVLQLTGATRANRYSALAEAGRSSDIGAGLTLTPRAQLAYGRYTLHGFEERGGETALAVEDMKVNRLEARLGAKLEGKARFAGIAVTPQLSADYVNLIAGRETGAVVRFAVAPDEAIALPLTTAKGGWAEVKGGVSFGDGPVTFGLNGQYSTGGADLSDQRAEAGLKIRF